MDYELSEIFENKFKRENIRIKKAILKTLNTFTENPYNTVLDNHPLKRQLKGLRNIHIIFLRSNDYCAIYKEIIEKDGSIYAYFLIFGKHKELF
jgi:mRNA-degrading endonuclease YafQ of YafQ-DinJ toxin-antitoxin module